MLSKSLIAVCLMIAPSFGATYYVSPKGTVDNDGTSERPWPSVQYALDKVGGGNTFILKAGIYPGPIAISKAYSGQPDSPTVIKSEVKWKAIVVGSSTHGVYTADNANWVVFDGLEVSGATDDGIKMQGDYGVVRNCYVHGSGSMGLSAHGKKGWTMERNLLEFNGQNPQFHHGIYADGDTFTIRDNIVRHNAGYGMQVYPSASNGYIMNNVVYGQPRKAGIILQSPKGGGHNVVANNTIADNVGGGISLSNSDTEVVISNIVTTASATPIVMNSASKNVWFANNLCQPACGVEGDGNITGDPLFVYTMRGAYYLMPGSPAIAAGKLELSAAQDFWGLTRKEKPDLGAFSYLQYMSTDASRSTWYSGYAYRFSLNSGQNIPDLWTLPMEAVPAP